MIGNIEIFFAENPNTPTRTTKNTSYVEIKSNWEKRVSKAIEQSKIPPKPYSQVFVYTNEFFNILLNTSDGLNNNSPCVLKLDENNQALILDNGIIAQGSSWESPRWNKEKNMYDYWDHKYDLIKEKFNLKYPNDIIWMKFTNKHHLGVVAKSFDINFNTDNTSGKLVEKVDEKWDNSFIFIFPLTKDILKKYNKDEIERAVGNYLISKGVPIIDYYSHNY